MSTKRKKKKRKNKIVLFIVEIIILAALLVGLYVYSRMNQVDSTGEIEQEEVNVELDSETAEVLKGYTNIALFGLDNREVGKYTSGNSDTIMIASINNDTKKVKLVSVYRDTFLNVKDDTYRKINAAYALGGPKGAIAALNKNLNLDIVDYVSVDFGAVVDAVDLLDGIELELTNQEVQIMNDNYIDEINKISSTFLERLKQSTQKEVIIYSDTSNARNVFSIELAKEYPLWIAEYGVEVPGESNWEFWEGFQYTSTGEVSGIRGVTDRDRFTDDIFLNDTTKIPESGNKENYNKDTKYIVQKGNTLSGIALKYGTTVNELVILNKINNPNLIFPGEEVIVPINGNINNEVAFSTGHIIYTVEAGDTLSELALRFKTTIDNIAKINNIEDINLIYVGEKLKIENNE